MEERFLRTAMLLGKDAITTLQGKRVMLVGLGGVGGYACEALCRAGVGELVLVDFDTVSVSNINRQILADDHTVGQKKTAAAAARIARISPQTAVYTVDAFVDADNAAALLSEYTPD